MLHKIGLSASIVAKKFSINVFTWCKKKFNDIEERLTSICFKKDNVEKKTLKKERKINSKVFLSSFIFNPPPLQSNYPSLFDVDDNTHMCIYSHTHTYEYIHIRMCMVPPPFFKSGYIL